MRKIALSLAIASALGLTACDDTTYNDVAQETEVVTPASRMVFDPSGGELSVPNDLLFSGTLDGTLNIPVADPADYGDPQNALNALDGWSTENAFVLDIDFPAGVSLDQSSATQPGAVRIFEAVMGGDLNDADCASVTRGLACKIVGELTFGVDFVNAPSGNSVAVVPLQPLKQATTYIVATTKVLRDSTGASVQASESYNLVRQDINTNPLSSESQLQLQAIINSFEGALSSQASVDLNTVNYTFAMTTESVGQVLTTVKKLIVADPMNLPSGGAQDTTCNVLDVLSAGATGRPECNLLMLDAPILDPSDPSNGIFAAANFHGGAVGLPHFLDPNNALVGRWTGNCDSGAVLLGYQAAGGTIPAEAQGPNDGLCMAASGGALRDSAEWGLPDGQLDKERHLTKFNVIPMLKGDDIPDAPGIELVPLQMTTPDEAVANAVRGSLGLPPLVKPAEGWPVVILYHGITSRKEDMLALTGALSTFGLATVAIDHPLHGQRTGLQMLPDGSSIEVNATYNSATDYMNLASLLTTRDNLRQSTADLLSLRIALHNMVDLTNGLPLDINPLDVSVVGHSLGAIAASTFTALTNSTLGDPTADAMYQVQTSVLANPGGGVANFLLGSPQFGPLIKAFLAIESSASFQAYYIGGGNVPPGQPGYDETVFVTEYLTWYNTIATDADKAEMAAVESQFVFAAQTVTDAGDPNNYAAAAVANGSTILAYEMVGDGMEDSVNLSDQVIPNFVEAAPGVLNPIAGTEPLFGFLNLNPITGNVAGTEPVSGAVRFLYGHHGSLLTPVAIPTVAEDNTAAVTGEMQMQIAIYLSTKGTAVNVTDGSLIVGGE